MAVQGTSCFLKEFCWFLGFPRGPPHPTQLKKSTGLLSFPFFPSLLYWLLWTRDDVRWCVHILYLFFSWRQTLLSIFRSNWPNFVGENVGKLSIGRACVRTKSYCVYFHSQSVVKALKWITTSNVLAVQVRIFAVWHIVDYAVNLMARKLPCNRKVGGNCNLFTYVKEGLEAMCLCSVAGVPA